MKKLNMTLTMLMSLFILTSCGTNNGDGESSSQSSIAQNDTSASSISSEESEESTSSISNSDEQIKSSISNSLEEPAESTSKSSEEIIESTPNTSENIINSEEDAFIFIKEQTGVEANNTDIIYEVVESNEDYYVLKLISKSIFEQGGSGTVGLYTIYKDGTYETGQK